MKLSEVIEALQGLRFLYGDVEAEFNEEHFGEDRWVMVVIGSDRVRIAVWDLKQE